MAVSLDADVIIIGSGAGGGTLARALASSGLSLLILERGDYLPREWGNWDPHTVFAEHRYHTHEQWRDGAGQGTAAGAVNSAAILLASADAIAPQGLANSSDQVGRNYMCHLNSACMALKATQENTTVFQKPLAINDFYNDSGEPDYPYPLGHIQNLGKVTPALLHAQQPRLPIPVSAWTASHSVDWWLTTEDLPDAGNRVTLDSDGHIRLAWQPKNRESHRRLCAQWRSILHLAGFPMVFFQAMDITATAHQVGTCRFGKDPANSVLDPWCKAHDLDNLYVVDASFMPSISAVNPSLTIMANAIRVAGHLTERFKTGTRT